MPMGGPSACPRGLAGCFHVPRLQCPLTVSHRVRGGPACSPTSSPPDPRFCVSPEHGAGMPSAGIPWLRKTPEEETLATQTMQTPLSKGTNSPREDKRSPPPLAWLCWDMARSPQNSTGLFLEPLPSGHHGLDTWPKALKADTAQYPGTQRTPACPQAPPPSWCSAVRLPQPCPPLPAPPMLCPPRAQSPGWE